MKITGPYIDMNGSQALRWCVTVYRPGVSTRIERFHTEEQAQQYADQMRATNVIPLRNPDPGDAAA
jgi:hypothetical protein